MKTAVPSPIAIIRRGDLRCSTGPRGGYARHATSADVGGTVGGAGEGTQVEDAAEEGPTVGDVGDEDGGAGFADVPECPDWGEGLREGVEFVEGGAEDLGLLVGEEEGRVWGWELTTKIPMPKRPHRTAFLWLIG